MNNPTKPGSLTPEEAASRWVTFQPPQLPEADRLAAAVQHLLRMTPEQVFQSSVHAGVHNSDGTLNEHYRETSSKD